MKDLDQPEREQVITPAELRATGTDYYGLIPRDILPGVEYVPVPFLDLAKTPIGQGFLLHAMDLARGIPIVILGEVRHDTLPIVAMKAKRSDAPARHYLQVPSGSVLSSASDTEASMMNAAQGYFRSIHDEEFHYNIAPAPVMLTPHSILDFLEVDRKGLVVIGNDESVSIDTFPVNGVSIAIPPVPGTLDQFA